MDGESDVGRWGEVKAAQLFPFCQQVSAPDDEALKESAYAPLFLLRFPLLSFLSIMISCSSRSDLPINLLIAF